MRFKCLGDPKTISEKIKLLVGAGCTDIIVGIQGPEKVNKTICLRNQTDENVLNAGKILNKYKNKLTVMYDVITCNPYKKPQGIMEVIRLLQKIPKPYYLSVNNLVFSQEVVCMKEQKENYSYFNHFLTSAFLFCYFFK